MRRNQQCWKTGLEDADGASDYRWGARHRAGHRNQRYWLRSTSDLLWNHDLRDGGPVARYRPKRHYQPEPTAELLHHVAQSGGGGAQSNVAAFLGATLGTVRRLFL